MYNLASIFSANKQFAFPPLNVLPRPNLHHKAPSAIVESVVHCKTILLICGDSVVKYKSHH